MTPNVLEGRARALPRGLPMNVSSSAHILPRLWLLVIAVVAIAVLYLAKVLFLPLAFAILFAFLLAPVVALLERIHLPRALAGMIVILGFAALLATAGWVLFTQLVSVANDLPTYRDNIAQKMEAIHTPSNSAFSRAEKEVEKLSEQLGVANSSAAPSLAKDNSDGDKPMGTVDRPVQVREVAHPTGRLDQLGGILEPLTTAALSVVFTFFVLLQREDLRNRLIRLSGDRNLTVMTQAMDDASRRISRYFSLQLLVNFVFGTVIALVLYSIGLPHALLFGAMAGLCRFIPYVGAPAAALAPTVLSLAVFHGWTHSALVVGTFLVLELVTGNYAEPHIYGKHTGLSSLAILVAAGFWTLIWGPVGLILSVPLTVCLVVMGSHVPSLEFLAVMLGDRPAISKWTCLYQRLLARDESEANEIVESELKERPLEEVYDSVLLPALVMSEEDRLHRDLEDGTVRFIRHAVRDMVEELGFRDDVLAEGGEGHLPAEQREIALRVLCLPVRDQLDELSGLMLALCLDEGPISAVSMPLRKPDEAVSSVGDAHPDVLVLSLLAPTGTTRARRLYRALRTRYPELKIMLGLWNLREDAEELGRKISGGEEARVVTGMADAVQAIRRLAGAEETVVAPHAGLVLQEGTAA